MTPKQNEQAKHLEIHAPGARNPVVEAQDNDTGHQGSQHEGRRLHGPTPVSQSHHLKGRAESLPNKNRETSILVLHARAGRVHRPAQKHDWSLLLET